jgi:hypothetical protein
MCDLGEREEAARVSVVGARSDLRRESHYAFILKDFCFAGRARSKDTTQLRLESLLQSK